MADGDGQTEVFMLAMIGWFALGCYGGYKGYEEWRHSPAESLRECTTGRAAESVELARLRTRASELESAASRTEYQLQTSNEFTGRETTVTVFRGDGAEALCERTAQTLGESTGNRPVNYFCRIAK